MAQNRSENMEFFIWAKMSDWIIFARWWKCSPNEAKAANIWCSTAVVESGGGRERLALHLIKSPSLTHKSLWRWICVLTRANPASFLSTHWPRLNMGSLYHSTDPDRTHLRQDPEKPGHVSAIKHEIHQHEIWFGSVCEKELIKTSALYHRTKNQIVCAWTSSALVHHELI